ncbi:MAG: nitrate reductase [Nitrospirae bacterium YQR-1]
MTDIRAETQWVKSTCPYCGFGCAVLVCIKDGAVRGIEGVKGYPVNNGHICPLASTLPQVFSAPDRLTSPLLRCGNKLTPVTWPEAVKHVADNLQRIIKEHGADAIAFYGGAANLTEEYYLVNKLIKGAVGTNNFECSTRLCMSSTAAGFSSTLGTDAPPACYADIEEADLFFIAGSNMAVSVPILFKRVSDAIQKNGTKVIVADPRKSETTSIADIHLRIRHGTDVALNNALAHVLIKEGFVNEDHVRQYASGLDELKEFLEDYPPSAAARITGCSAEEIIKAARMMGNAKALLAFWFMGYNHSTQAVFKNNTVHNLLLLTGNYCRAGAGPLSITGEANTLGNRMVGALSHLLPGFRQVLNHHHRKEVAAYWGVPFEKIHPMPGRSIIDIIKGLHSGEIRALWVMTTNPAVSLPHTRWIEEGLSKAELLIVQDIFPTETTALAGVVLPAAQWGEKTGTFVSSERRVELVEKFTEPPGEAKPDYEIIWLIAAAMGFKHMFPYTHPEEVFEEWKGLTRGRICDITGITYSRLRGNTGVQFPCPDNNHPGTPRLFTDMRFHRADGRAALLPRSYKEAAEVTTDEYPFILSTGRLSCHFNTRSRTGRIPVLNRLAPESFVEIHYNDAHRLGIAEGDSVKVTSGRGTVHVCARLTDRVPEGTLYMPSHYGRGLNTGEGKLANLLTNPAYDEHSKQPEFKICAVNISK